MNNTYISDDKNRVKLPVTDTAVGTDYINASYVEVNANVTLC